MRPPRLILVLICLTGLPLLFGVFTLLLHSETPPSSSPTSAGHAGSGQKSGLRAFFSFPTPSALFPLSAIITLTDDNSTFFLARPAAFGPLLPTRGLRGQLWVGSGFAEDNARREPGLGTSAEGELGCSDVPGWRSERDERGIESKFGRDEAWPGRWYGDVLGKTSGVALAKRDEDVQHRKKEDRASLSTHDARVGASFDDGTDDYLHHPLPGSDISKQTQPGQIAQQGSPSAKGGLAQHADIQSLQEGAEITGKVVLLSRGGCGFLEKVKWVQRRGGLALIVGDNTRGGGLVTMYARGDTSNVSIPSLFTSHTTAHLLSSLVPPESNLNEPESKDSSKPKEKGQTSHPETPEEPNKIDKSRNDHPIFTPAAASRPRKTSAVRPGSERETSHHPQPLHGGRSPPTDCGISWIQRLLRMAGLIKAKPLSSRLEEDSRRPPSSGQLDWVWVKDGKKNDDFTMSRPPALSSPKTDQAKPEANVSGRSSASRSNNGVVNGDDFVIGVQDWRDKDLLVHNSGKEANPSAEGQAQTVKIPPSNSPGGSSVAVSNKQQDDRLFDGRVITPGSGEYADPAKLKKAKSPSVADGVSSDTQPGQESQVDEMSEIGWLRRLSWPRQGDDIHSMQIARINGQRSQDAHLERLVDKEDQFTDPVGDDEELHEGLWVTLTPTSMATSPFLDTLLVLVISPLVTLTVVYALLLVRSRIRRRRWRAPKSVVDKLPVRIYHTMPSSSNQGSLTGATSNTTSPTSLLLYSQPTSESPRQLRPQPALDTLAPTEEASSQPLRACNEPNVPEAEKAVAAAAGLDRRYVGKQIECVICLEEYVDGVSRVMSLPCGHEFHVECM